MKRGLASRRILGVVIFLFAALFLVAAVSAQTLKDVPRNRTLVLGWSISSPIGVTNPWAVPGYTHQEGNAFMWEPLYYFAIFADKEIPWLAQSMKYNRDFTELTIKMNPKAMWSDGVPVTSTDVVFTFEGQMKNDKLPYHGQFVEFVKSVRAPDKSTAIVTFKQPSPRFMFEVLDAQVRYGHPHCSRARPGQAGRRERVPRRERHGPLGAVHAS